MRKLLLLFAIAAVSLAMAQARPLPPQRVSVEQLRQTLAALHGRSDSKMAKKIAALELTQRLSRAAFDEISKTLPGEKSRTALLGVADASAFLDPPASEMLPDSPPDAQAQREILKKAAQFAENQTDELPNFAAIRRTAHFQDTRIDPYSNRIFYYTPGSFRLADYQVDDIRGSAGGDEVQETPDKDLDNRLARRPHPLTGMTPWGFQTIFGDITWAIPNESPSGLKPTGAFGPWLEALTADVPEGQTAWGYWERAGSTRLAVLRFRIPQENSHYTIQYHFIPDLKDPYKFDPGREYTADPGYHGEIAIDPATGQIARILVICDFAKGDPMLKAAIELDYGPVEIDGERYFLPLRGVSSSSVSVTSNHRTPPSSVWDMNFETQTDHFRVSTVDDLSFSDYGVYKPRLRIVPLKSLARPAN